LCDSIEIMPKEIIVQRVSAGIDDSSLLAPSWCGESKNYQMACIKEELLRRGYVY